MSEDASERARGTANRGVETNVRKGQVSAIVPGKNYNVAGFDIGKADLTKPGFEKELKPVVQQLQRERKEFIAGKRTNHPLVKITGHASESIKPGKGPQFYANERAEALRKYLIAHDIPPDWIQTTTSRESLPSRGVNVHGSPEQKAMARSGTVEIGESENISRAAYRRGLENRYADPPDYLTMEEYEARKRPPRSDLRSPYQMSRPPDMALTAPDWPQPPLITQVNYYSCWAAALSSWLRAVGSPLRKSQNALMENENAFVGITISHFQAVAKNHEMLVTKVLKRTDFSPQDIIDTLRISPVILAFNVDARGTNKEEWWHDVVVYNHGIDPKSRETTFYIMDPGPSGDVQTWTGSETAKYLEVKEKFFFPAKGSGEWIIACSDKAIKRKK